MSRIHTRRRSLFVGLIAGALLLEGSAQAFCRSTTCRSTKERECTVDEDGCITDGAPLAWPTSCLSYAMNRLGTQDLDPVDTRAAIQKSFEAWMNVDCSDGTVAKMTFVERDPIACKRSQYNKEGPNVNVVLFQDDDWKYRGIDGTLAKTSVTYDNVTGEIFDADIEVNTANNQVTLEDDPDKVEYDLQAILTHEVGHFIGIAHSPDPAAVMYASYSPGSLSQRKLHPDDVDAVCAIYPSTSTAPERCDPKNGFSSVCPKVQNTGLCSVETGGGGPSYGVAMIVVGSTLLGARARARRRRRALERSR